VTDQELREQLADWFDEIALARGLAISYEELADQILALIKEAGYVKLSKDQHSPDLSVAPPPPTRYAQ
jgi:hypothetical protein